VFVASVHLGCDRHLSCFCCPCCSPACLPTPPPCPACPGAPGVAREWHIRQGQQHRRLQRRNHEVGPSVFCVRVGGVSCRGWPDGAGGWDRGGAQGVAGRGRGGKTGVGKWCLRIVAAHGLWMLPVVCLSPLSTPHPIPPKFTLQVPHCSENGANAGLGLVARSGLTQLPFTHTCSLQVPHGGKRWCQCRPGPGPADP
jgi:hypothetical protein